VAVDNKPVHFTVRWQLQGQGPNPPQPPPTIFEAVAHDPLAAGIARKIAEMSEVRDYGDIAIRQRFDQSSEPIVDPKDKARQEALAQTFDASADDALQAERDHFAAALVFAYSRQELKDIQGFLATPSGAGFIRKLIVVLSVTFAQQNSARLALVDAWRKQYCAKVVCNPRELERFQRIRADLVAAASARPSAQDARRP
jgi:hypothetical protein